jgi:hypothetical protein
MRMSSQVVGQVMGLEEVQEGGQGVALEVVGPVVQVQQVQVQVGLQTRPHVAHVAPPA